MTSTLFVAAVKGEAAYVPADVLITGIGTVPAAIAVTQAVLERKPDRVINIGTAGALVDGLSGVFEISHVTKHDFHLEMLTDVSKYLLPETYELETSGKLPTAGLATGDMFVSKEEVRRQLAQASSLVDMEGYAIVAACKKLGVPVTLLKQVSDNANEESFGTWADAVDRGAQELAAALDVLAG